MVTIKVISPDGWQNGDTLWPQGKVMTLECDQEDIQAFIDHRNIEIHKPKLPDKIDPGPTEREQKTIDLTVKAMVEAMKTINPQTASIKVRERAEDDPNCGFKSFIDFAHEIYKDTIGFSQRLRDYDKLIKTTGHMAEGDDVQGGHLVPTGFRATLLQTMLEASIVRQRATFVPMATNSIGIPAIHDYSHANGTQLYGALKMYRPGEGDSKTASKPQFDLVQLTLHKMTYLTYVSDELLEDSPISIDPLLRGMFSNGITWHEDNDFINGTGVNMALGVMAAPCLISVTRDPATGYLSYLDLCNMWSRLHPKSMANAIWLISPSMIPYVYTACVTCTGSDGSDLTGHPVMLPSAGASAVPYNTIFGRPVIVTEHCQAAGTTGKNNIAPCLRKAA